MFTYTRIRGFVALVVLLAIVFTTTPISAADFSSPKAVIGSVSGVGAVQLRGVAISREGTLFRGDQISVGAKGYAKVTLTNGHKLELDSMTKLTIVGSGEAAQLQVTSGNLAFVTKSGTLNIAAGNFEIVGDHNVVGNVAFVGNGYVGLRVKTGTATVHNLMTKETVKVTAGQERLFGLNSEGKAPLVQLASIALPDPIPAAPQAGRAGAPQGATPAKAPASGITTTGWITIFATIGGATAGIVLLSRNGGTTTDVAGTLHQQQTLGAANQAALTAGNASTAATSVATAANQASAAINAAPVSANLSTTTKATLVAQANSLAASATTTQQQTVALQSQLASLQTQLAAVTDAGSVNTITASINSVISSLNGDIGQLNATIASLNILLSTARADGVANIPTFSVTPIPPAPTASASIPS